MANPETDSFVMPGAEWKAPPATLVSFVYDERPCLNLMRSIIRDARRWPSLSIWDKSKDALIGRMRSDVATQFLEQGNGDVLIMVDHDIGWAAGDLEHITRVCLELKAVVGGVHPKRGFGLPLPIRWGNYGTYTVPDDRVVECTSVTTAFMAIHRSVLEALAETLPMTRQGYRTFFEEHSITLEDGTVDPLSEDYDFCIKARNAGFRVFADLRPQLTHFGTHLFEVADSLWKPPARGQTVQITVKDPTKPVEVNGGYSLWIDQDDQFVSDSLIRTGSWEPETLLFLEGEIREGDVVVEVGSNLGAHTIPLALDSRVAKVVAVEPMPHLVDLLRRNVALNEVGDKVDIWAMAMVAEDDLRRSARMLRDTQNPGASHLLMDVEETSLGVEVPTCRLRDVADRIDILKLDCEGAEYLVLKEAASNPAFGHCRAILTEYCDAQLREVSGVPGVEYLRLLESLGFDTGVADPSALPRGRAYCNIAAVRR